MVVDYEVEIGAVDQETATPVNATNVKAGLSEAKDKLLNLSSVDQNYVNGVFELLQNSTGKCSFL